MRKQILAGNDTKLTPRQVRGLTALVACPTIEAAAEQAGVGVRTLYHGYMNLFSEVSLTA